MFCARSITITMRRISGILSFSLCVLQVCVDSIQVKEVNLTSLKGFITKTDIPFIGNVSHPTHNDSYLKRINHSCLTPIAPSFLKTFLTPYNLFFSFSCICPDSFFRPKSWFCLYSWRRRNRDFHEKKAYFRILMYSFSKTKPFFTRPVLQGEKLKNNYII